MHEYRSQHLGDLVRENAALRAERDALRAENAQLRRALSASNEAREAQEAPEAQALLDSAPVLRAVLEQLPIGVAIADAPSGRLLVHNAEAMRLLGHPMRPSPDYTGYAQYGGLHPDGAPYAPEDYPITRALLQETSVPAEDLRYRRGDGTTTTFAVSAAPVRDATGRVVAVVSAFTDVAAQRAAQQALRESEARFAAAFQGSPVALAITAATDGRILDANARFLELFGQARDALLGQSTLTLGMWDDPAERAATLAVLAREGRVRDREVIVRAAGGEHRHILLSMEPLRINGEPCLLSALTDITERKQAEAALRQSQALYRTIARNLPDASIIVVDRELRYLLAEGTLVAMFGFRQEQLVGRTPSEILPPQLAALIEERFGRALGGEAIIVESSYRDRALWNHYLPLRDEQGTIWAAMALSLDITTRKAAEVALARSEALHRAIVRNLPDAGVFVVDRELRYLLAEGPLLPALGMDGEHMEKRTPAEVFEPRLRAQIEERWRRALSGEEIVDERSIAGRTLWTHVGPLRDEQGTIWAAMALILDVSQRTRLEEQLRQAQKMESIGQLAGGIAHDFNNLLTAIGGYVEFARADLPPDAEVQADLSEIQRATERAATLTRQLLAFARRQRMELQPFDLSALVVSTEKLLRRLIGEHIQLVVEATPGLPQILADPGQLEQVLINLALNARDAMPQGGKLTITTATVALDPRYAHGQSDLPAGDYVLLTVSDTGVGIPPEHLPHLFEPFFTTKPVGQGTGLGLATCYGIIKQHGGMIFISSEFGHGTVVTVYLPRGKAAPVDAAPKPVTMRLPHGTETVLLAEDEPAVRALAARILKACGYTVMVAENGEEALRLARAHAPEPIHLLLTDVVMPKLGGPGLAAQLRTLYPALRVLFISGYTDLRSASHEPPALEASLLQKPFLPLSLATAVRAILDAT
jgi:two-component system, cell cycle sensor histidine kinase and response regulator CckA